MSTEIQWTDETWNPVTGCAKVSPGCAHCYAEGVAARFWPQQYVHTVERGFISAKSYSGERMDGKPRAFTDVMTHADRLDQPLRWRKPRKVFVNSMSDLFHEDVPDSFIGKVFETMACAKQHTFQILTKRAARMRDFMIRYTANGGPLGPIAHNFPHVWLGVSVENQRFADERIPLLLQTPAAVRFISAEPLLGPVDLRDLVVGSGHVYPLGTNAPGGRSSGHGRLDWVIVGGESGSGARPCATEWIESIARQCQTAGVPVFVKQLGAYVVSEGRTAPLDHFSDPTSPKLLLAPNGEAWAWRAGLRDRKGGDPSEWPEDLRVRQFPEARRSSEKVGKL